MIGIRCERTSHQFFKRYGERFEDSEGKQIFLEFADEERRHLDLLLREYILLTKRGTRAKGKQEGGRREAEGERGCLSRTSGSACLARIYPLASRPYPLACHHD